VGGVGRGLAVGWSRTWAFRGAFSACCPQQPGFSVCCPQQPEPFFDLVPAVGPLAPPLGNGRWKTPPLGNERWAAFRARQPVEIAWGSLWAAGGRAKRVHSDVENEAVWQRSFDASKLGRPTKVEEWLAQSGPNRQIAQSGPNRRPVHPTTIVGILKGIRRTGPRAPRVSGGFGRVEAGRPPALAIPSPANLANQDLAPGR
jgi:hypothetical protein